MRIFFCSMAISFFSSCCAPCRNVLWLFSISSMSCRKWRNRQLDVRIIHVSFWHRQITVSALIHCFNWVKVKGQFGHCHLHKLFVQLSNHLQLLVLHHSSLLQDLQLLSEHALQMGNIIDAPTQHSIYCTFAWELPFSGGQHCCQNSSIALEQNITSVAPLLEKRKTKNQHWISPPAPQISGLPSPTAVKRLTPAGSTAVWSFVWRHTEVEWKWWSLGLYVSSW